MNTCSKNAYHVQPLADIKAPLASNAPPVEIERAVVTCPLCGCPVG